MHKAERQQSAITAACRKKAEQLRLQQREEKLILASVIDGFPRAGVLSVASVIGFVTLFGIATPNGVMLIAHIHRLVEKEGVTDPVVAVTRGALKRLAPILMTAVAAGLVLVPLALSGGEPGSEIQTPMAIVIPFGLLSSTARNMIVVPAPHRVSDQR